MILSTKPIGAKSGRGRRLKERGDEAEAKLCQREELSATGTRAETTTLKRVAGMATALLGRHRASDL
jgi:hypothetical protein